ncbi:MAG: hypothetical protein IKK24_02180 [Clostridia bacterium]|nr:hypothetical protein [Clostridia bacterium]
MKRIFAFILCLCLVFCLVGCGKDKKKDDNKPAHSVDVEYYAKLGQIPEHKYALGADVKEMQDAFDAEDEANKENSDDDHLHSVYSLMEMDDYSFLSYSNANYYFNDNSDDSVYCIVSLDTAYGFEIGDMNVEIKEALSKFSTEEKQGDKETLFFLPGAEGCTYLEYTFGENTVIFAFQDNSLCATMLKKSN